MALCAGNCGRVGAGPFDSGQPDVDERFTWCDSCWADLHNRRMPAGLVKDLPAGTLVPFTPAPRPELNSLARIEHKIMTGVEIKSTATIGAAPVTGNGTFTGYLAAYGRDFGGDQLMPGSMDETAAAVNSGAIQWFLTDAHSEKASDVVARVTAAAVDHYGLRVAGEWMPGERAQALRQMVRNGAKLGMSIDYLTDSARPDGKGGRLLDRITVVGGAVTPRPMNSGAYITEGKHAASAPVRELYADVYEQSQRRERQHPERLAEDRLLAAASWPPPSWPRDLRLSMIRGAEEAKARRELEGDPVRAREQAIREQNERYCLDLAATMARLRAR